MPCRTRQVAPAFERLKEIRLVGFDDVVQLRAAFLRWPLQQAMPPAKRRARMNARVVGGGSKAAAFDHRPRVIRPRRTTFQPRQRRAGQGIEGPPTIAAPVALNPGLTAPALHRRRLAMRAGQYFPCPSIHPVTGIMAGLAIGQPLFQLLALSIRQLAKLMQPDTE